MKISAGHSSVKLFDTSFAKFGANQILRDTKIKF